MIYDICESIVNFLYEKYEESCVQGHYDISGDVYYVDGFMPTDTDLRNGVYILRSSTLFLIGNSDGEFFTLYIFKGPKFYMDQTLGIKVPVYLHDTLNDVLMYNVIK